MPVHDWTRVNAGIFHDFNHEWISTNKRALNSGLLPPEYYALAEQIAAGSRIAAFADANGWLVLLPRQTKHANAWGCWNWFDRRTIAGKGEAAIIAAQVRAVRRLYGAKGADSDIDTIAFEARAEASPRALPLPLCVIHGEHDPVVAQKNSTELLRQFLIFNGRFAPSSDGLPDPDSSKVTRLSNGRTMTTDDYRVNGRVVARRIRVAGLGHAWSGGDGAFAYNDPQPPDATALFGEFFAAQLRRRDVSVEK